MKKRFIFLILLSVGLWPAISRGAEEDSFLRIPMVVPPPHQKVPFMTPMFVPPISAEAVYHVEGTTPPICVSVPANQQVCNFLLTQYAAGLAAGNVGDFYDNRDGRHVYLTDISTDHPQIGEIATGGAGQPSYVVDKVVVGQASEVYYDAGGYDFYFDHVSTVTSIIIHDYMLNGYGANTVYTQYRHNNYYWYPCAWDHIARDCMMGMLPDVSASQGFSGSELDELKKFFFTLAAFRPDVKAKLKTEGLLMPTLQMIARRTRVTSDADYLSYKAHPNAFDNASNTLLMVQMANGIDITNIPPMVQIKVLGDDYVGLAGVDHFDPYYSERLYDTPVSIARIWRGHEYTKKIRVSAEDSFDLNNRTLTYHWAVVRGDPQHVRITPANAQGSVVDIEIDYHPETTVEGSTRLTDLVAVGAFVHNGAYYSAPAFVTSFSLHNETRTYDVGTKLLSKIDYGTGYVHPSIAYPKAWTSDMFNYSVAGTLTGWTRLQNGTSYDFTPEGYVGVTKVGNTVTAARHVQYQINYSNKRVEWTATGSTFTYTADSIPPVVSISTPLAGQAVSGVVPIIATVTDNVGVYRVEFYIDGQRYGTCSTPPYTYSWDSSSASGGNHTIEVKAYDSNDNVTTVSLVVATAGTAGELGSVVYTLNKFNPVKSENAVFDVNLNAPCHLTVTVYNRHGDKVKELVNEDTSASVRNVTWDGRNSSTDMIASGIYLVVVEAGSHRSVSKVAVIK